MAPAYRWSREGPHEPVPGPDGRGGCEIPDCERVHKGFGLCRMHYLRAKATGDPLRKSRFATEAEKEAFIAAQISTRKSRAAQRREMAAAEAEYLELFRVRARRRIAPQAVALVDALDRLPMPERAAVASVVVDALLGRPLT